MGEKLTAREYQILACLAEGLSNQEIANRLSLADKTVRWYNTQLYNKLNVKGRAEAVDQAKLLGLLSDTVETMEGKHNLPIQSTPFVGRQQELTEVLSLINDDTIRLITILGAGGMGKTRLALRLAETQIEHFADGVFFVPLTPLSLPDDIITTIAENIGFIFHGEKPPHQQLVNFLRNRSILLILDNFEHLLAGSLLVNDIVKSSPYIKIIVTSRERLNLNSETVYGLRGLKFPKQKTLVDLMAYDAVQLFLTTAYRVYPQFKLQPTDHNYLILICAIIGGMPLGIELAAGWLDVLSLEQIVNEVQRGIDILESDLLDVPQRHRSIRAAIGYTWDRLSHEEQSIFARLSVFRGGFTVTAAQAVAEANIRQLRKLSQKALIQMEPHDRFSIHELLRQFAEAKLADTGELQVIRDTHMVYFTEFMADRISDIKTNQPIEALELIDPDFENVRLAWLQTVNNQRWDLFPKTLFSLWYYCSERSRSHDIIYLFEYALQALKAIEHTSETHLARGRIMAWIGWFYTDLGFRPKGKEICHKAIEILQQHPDKENLIIAYSSLALFAVTEGNHDYAQKIYHESYQLAQEVEDHYWEGWNLSGLAWSKIVRNENDALAVLTQWRGFYGSEYNPDNHKEAFFLYNIGNFSQAKDILLRILLYRLTRLNSAYRIAETSLYLGINLIRLYDYQEANRYLIQALRLLWDAGYTHFALASMLRIALVMSYTNDIDKAVEIVSKLSEYPAVYLSPYGLHDIHEPLRMQLQAKLDPYRFAAAWERGQRYELNALIIEVLAKFGDNS